MKQRDVMPMETVSTWIQAARRTTSFVVLDAQVLMHEYGPQAFWIARERYIGRGPDLGRGPSHWKRVAELIAQRQGIVGETQH